MAGTGFGDLGAGLAGAAAAYAQGRQRTAELDLARAQQDEDERQKFAQQKELMGLQNTYAIQGEQRQQAYAEQQRQKTLMSTIPQQIAGLLEKGSVKSPRAAAQFLFENVPEYADLKAAKAWEKYSEDESPTWSYLANIYRSDATLRGTIYSADSRAKIASDHDTVLQAISQGHDMTQEELGRLSYWGRRYHDVMMAKVYADQTHERRWEAVLKGEYDLKAHQITAQALRDVAAGKPNPAQKLQDNLNLEWAKRPAWQFLETPDQQLYKKMAADATNYKVQIAMGPAKWAEEWAKFQQLGRTAELYKQHWLATTGIHAPGQAPAQDLDAAVTALMGGADPTTSITDPLGFGGGANINAPAGDGGAYGSTPSAPNPTPVTVTPIPFPDQNPANQFPAHGTPRGGKPPAGTKNVPPPPGGALPPTGGEPPGLPSTTVAPNRYIYLYDDAGKGYPYDTWANGQQGAFVGPRPFGDIWNKPPGQPGRRLLEHGEPRYTVWKDPAGGQAYTKDNATGRWTPNPPPGGHALKRVNPKTGTTAGNPFPKK